MRHWQVQDAKARFSELLDASLKEGPQVVTRRGVPAAVLVPVETWTRMAAAQKPTLKDLLLTDENRFDIELPRRGQRRRRPGPDFGD